MTRSTALAYPDITDVDGCREVVQLQESVWGRDGETVPKSVLLASVRRGGILIGAREAGALVGFVWSMPGVRDGQLTHWSHMTGVRSDARGRGIGERLKWAQRDRALAAGIDLIEWTFDPLQAPNAHFNFACLGAVASEYHEDAYGPLAGPLHRGTPTDRLVAEWWIRRPHVERRIAARQRPGSEADVDRQARSKDRALPLHARSAELLEAPQVIATHAGGEWLTCVSVDTGLADRRVLVAVPPDFTRMQQQAPDIALAWRLGVREAFTAYFSRGYRAVDFFFDRVTGSGAYLVARDPD
jgi:predicted GNAT superfamily acetyltransferase